MFLDAILPIAAPLLLALKLRGCTLTPSRQRSFAHGVSPAHGCSCATGGPTGPSSYKAPPRRAAGGAGHHGHVGSQPQDHPSPQSHYAPMLLCQADEVSRGSCHVSDTSVRQVQGKRAISARSPQKKCYAYPRCTFLSNSGAAGQGGNLRHCERVFFNMRLVAPTCLLLEEKSPLLSDIPVLCYRRAEEHASLETRQDGQTVRRSCASTTPRTVGMPMVGRLV
jgi:hypothetical protein